jgi:hypothetical protein
MGYRIADWVQVAGDQLGAHINTMATDFWTEAVVNGVSKHDVVERPTNQRVTPHGGVQATYWL